MKASAVVIGALLCGCPTPGPPAEGPTNASAHVRDLSFGVVGPNVKIRPRDRPPTVDRARLRAARNEVEAFQVVLLAKGRAVPAVSLALTRPLATAEGVRLPGSNVTLYRVGYYELKTPSASVDSSGRWPDPLIPALDTYVGEQRRAFPFIVPERESRTVWVDVRVPSTAAPGHYLGELEVRVANIAAGRIPIELHVGRFSLPSTPSLTTAFGMEFDQPCKAHTGHVSCSREWDEPRANRLRARYLRAAIEHRVTIHDPFFQPPFGQSARFFERLVHPLLVGAAPGLRLPGARVTSVRLPVDEKAPMKRWLAYLARLQLADRMFYFPVDEPTGDQWRRFGRLSRQLHGLAPEARIALTAMIDEAQRAGVAEQVDIFVPSLTALAGRADALGPYHRWRAAGARRQLWTYLSCRTHGCDRCGVSRPQVRSSSAWPNRLIDGTGVQNRALPWLAFLLDLQGELYADVAARLSTAWKADGLCLDSGAGEGTLFYPGTPAVIGGRTHIPVESIRLKLIREGLEDYEYLVLAARKDPPRVQAIARALFPQPDRCARPPAALEGARQALFELLDR